MDTEHAVNPRGIYGTKKDWINYFNFQGSRMASSAELIGAPDSGSEELLGNLQTDLKGSEKACILSSTVTIFNTCNPRRKLAGIIAHDYSSLVAETPREISLAEIPFYKGIPVNLAVQTDEGLAYVRALANDERLLTKDRLLQEISDLFGESPENILLWTLDPKFRSEIRTMPVAFGWGSQSGHIDSGCVGLRNYNGFAYGARSLDN